jgi:hypothetical protein
VVGCFSLGRDFRLLFGSMLYTIVVFRNEEFSHTWFLAFVFMWSKQEIIIITNDAYVL